MKSLKDDPISSKFNNILLGIPTFGFPTINFALSLKSEGSPIFTSMDLMPVIGKPVDVARNEIAYTAVKQNYAFVLFRDDDVVVPFNSLIKLFGRMSAEQRAKPREVAEAIVGGIVYSKVQPPQPMIYLHDCVGGFEDWNFGDLVECDTMGMGNTLVPVGAFNKIIESGYDKYQCVNDACVVKWDAVYKREDKNCPHCDTELAPIFFKTVRRGDGMDDAPLEMTEDTYFCLLAKDNGVKIYADCGVQCKHEDVKNGVQYYFHEGLGIPVWEGDSGLEFWPQAKTTTEASGNSAKEKPKKKEKVRFNAGCGDVHKKGFINIDLNTSCDFKCDARDLRPAVAKYGLADEIEADHVIEHFNRSSVTTAVRNWIKALKPGGKLTFRAPDAIAAMKDFIEADGNSKAKTVEYDFKEQVVFGAQRYPGDTHMSAMTEKKAKKIISSCRNMIEDYNVWAGKRDEKWADEIIVTVTKKKAKSKGKKK